MDDIWTSNLKETVNNIKNNNNVYTTGKVVKVNDYIIEVTGLNDVTFYEEVNVDDKASGYVSGIYSDRVIVALVNITDSVKPGDMVYALRKEFKCLFSLDSVGKVIDIFGNDLIAGKRFDNLVEVPIENDPIPIMDRGLVEREFLTGITGIDMLYPIGRGQRQLIIGDKKTGKTQIALDTIVNQKNKDVICIYVAIGQKESTIASVVETLKANDALKYSIVVAASASEAAPLLYLAPYAGVSMAEEFMYNGKDVLIIYDDLTKHAVAYRELSLLLKRPPGREAFPGDVFYLHSRLLERAAKLSNELGGGSITALPIIETQAGDISAYIPTNVISITDGQIFLQSDLFYSGIRPAVSAGLSVSRVGGNAQIKAVKKVSGTLRLDLASFRELEAFTQFGSDLDASTKAKLERGKRTVEILKQPLHKAVTPVELTVLVYALTHSYLDNISIDDLADYENKLYLELKNTEEGQEITKQIMETKVLPEGDILDKFLTKFTMNY